MRAWLASVAIVAFVCSAFSAAEAATVTAIRLDPTNSGGATLTATTTGGQPTYHVIGAGTADVNIVLDATTFGAQVPPVIPGAGSVSSVTVASTGSNSSMTLHLTGPAPVRVRATPAALIIDISAPAGTNPNNPFGVPQDSTIAGIGPVTEVVMLKYADISEIAGLLSQSSNIPSNDSFTPQQSNFGTNGLGGVSGSFGQQSTTQVYGGGNQFGQPQGLAQYVNQNVSVDRRLNAIILNGTADVVAGLKAIIAKVDVPVPSVILETQIIELNETAARNIGIEFSPSGTGIVANASGVSSGGGGYIVRSLQTGQGEITAESVLYAQITNGNAKVIAKPRILAMSGQQASILTGDAIPIVTSVVVAGAGSTVSQQVNYVNVGVNLQILPRVSSDGFVTSHIYSDVSSVTSFQSGIPEISQRTANTQATVRDGESFIIGGLLQDNEIRSLTKLPFVGDLPLIGVFFRHVTTSHTQTNLYLVVTPHIVHPASPGSVPVPFVPPPLSVKPFATDVPAPLDGTNTTYHLSTLPTPSPSPSPAPTSST